MAQLTLTDANISDASFWSAQDFSVGSFNTIDASNISDTFQVTLTAGSISFTDTTSGAVTTYSDADLASGSFSGVVQFIGNNADSTVSGSVGLNGSGYSGGDGNDSFTDDGSNGGTINGGDGDDVLQGGTGDNNINGGDGDDILRGGSGGNNLNGGNNNDTLFAEDGSGNLQGNGGDDTIYVGLNTSFVNGGNGIDTMIVPEGSTVAPFSPGAKGGNITLPNGRSVTYQNIENVTIACFVQGTLIKTPNGERPIEDLSVGDMVDTLDHGPQAIRWIGGRKVPGQGKHAPICFLPGSIGNSDRLRLSPQHRVLMSGWKCELLFGEPEVLCAAKHLCDGDQIFAEPCEEVSYFHMMFDQHEIVFSNGAETESFFAGDHIAAADRETFEEIVELFPELQDGTHGAQQPARMFTRAFEARALR